MPLAVCMGAQMMCSFGAAPSALVIAGTTVMIQNMPAATIMDNKPMANVPPFGVCMSMANPAVASATAAALGVLTPQPCTPVLPAPWAPPATKVLIAKKPALPQNAMLNCAYGGVITITNPGQVKVNIT